MISGTCNRSLLPIKPALKDRPRGVDAGGDPEDIIEDAWGVMGGVGWGVGLTMITLGNVAGWVAPVIIGVHERDGVEGSGDSSLNSYMDKKGRP